uniref:Glutamine amidotransferase domain-containing protein n=1 Tax=Ananas comosus var. bracteatus TaxID=296719 RepID=A0A6V7Q2Q3_ANACO|nr:unnamed protein product [Ananas comosus var. bracteatus]
MDAATREPHEVELGGVAAEFGFDVDVAPRSHSSIRLLPLHREEVGRGGVFAVLDVAPALDSLSRASSHGLRRRRRRWGDAAAADAAAATEVRGAGVRGGGARARAEGARGYFGIFAKLLGDHNNGGDDNGEEEEEEVWVAYRAARCELPQEEGGFEGFEGYNGFVVTGSCSDAHDDDPWIRDLVRFLQMLIARRKKVLGICFGHQVRANEPNTSRLD